ncbi:tetraacyldisaccharide 4'-kinase [Acetobacter sp. TBRC 12305]|uniref:Tetraacyldisaccharide 4'-kinase n=1 Tax=Acetobacter garciniae TaxID=2817435 RepID=A0A939KLD6_9PROT|nr:tetraacyldisaccharide 4'-kinase [Acetobacter garciniae]MBO1324158.1 tetraacyldisaccharide 4'-kinase [Acetobacter garciniae]MBX0343847.1 tetraacyldisaccharide 4'-kinase [Acetobacter garciniae]
MLKRRPPAFWSDPKARLWPWLLSPFEGVVAYLARHRQRRQGWSVPVPVLCCGNLTTGGTGKTTVIMDLATRLIRQGKHPHVLTRGYGGRAAPGTRVDPARHTARDVGDEPVLLAGICPVWVGADRVQTARAAVAAGADCLLMDDGFQNPGLNKTFSLLVVDGSVGLANGHVLPAGPLRERPAEAFARASAVLVIGPDRTGVCAGLAEYGLPVFRAGLVQSADVAALHGRACVAFAGLGRPEKFFEGVRAAGIRLARALAYPDHYFYKSRDMRHLSNIARAEQACLVTTPKDAVRLPPAFRCHVVEIGVDLVWEHPADAEWIISTLFERFTAHAPATMAAKSP